MFVATSFLSTLFGSLCTIRTTVSVFRRILSTENASTCANSLILHVLVGAHFTPGHDFSSACQGERRTISAQFSGVNKHNWPNLALTSVFAVPIIRTIPTPTTSITRSSSLTIFAVVIFSSKHHLQFKSNLLPLPTVTSSP